MRAAGTLAVVALLLAGLVTAAPASAQSLDLQVYPDVVEIGTFFRGHGVTVSARIPAGAQAVMEIVGSTAAEHLLRKGRRGGLWMNTGEIEFQQAPSIYMAASTTPELLTAAPPTAAWGYQALKQRITLSGDFQPAEREIFLDQFFKLKESENVYAVFPGAVKAAKPSGDLQKVTGTFTIPTNIKPGVYEVCLSVIQNGEVTAKKCQSLKVEMVGFPAALSSLAYNHGATYGILAVLIAIITGFAMGYLFRGGGGH
jgi:hypothetical protein